MRRILDAWCPPVFREKWPFTSLVKFWLGRNALVDFKHRAFNMTDSEFVATYRGLEGAYVRRSSDTTPEQTEWLLAAVERGKKVLEIGPGNRDLTERILREKGSNVVTLDLAAPSNSIQGHAVVGVAERLPFANKAVDLTIAAHVIEHVRSLTKTFIELERVTRERVLLITPRQRYYRVTFDYHLHFFYSLAHFASHIPRGSVEGKIVDEDLCLIWDVRQ